jgi:hypothetical protein
MTSKEIEDKKFLDDFLNPEASPLESRFGEPQIKDLINLEIKRIESFMQDNGWQDGSLSFQDEEPDELWIRYVIPHEHKFIVYPIPLALYNRCWIAACERAIRKLKNILLDKDLHYKYDRNRLVERNFSGILVEVYLGEVWGIKDMIGTLGLAKDYNRPDLYPLGINLGIKGSQYGNLAMIQKSPKYGEVIGFVKIKERILYVAGVASTRVLIENQDPNGIKNAKNHNKTAFSGYGLMSGIVDGRMISSEDMKKKFPFASYYAARPSP